MDSFRQAVDRYITREQDNGYDLWLEKVWDNIGESDISSEDYEKYEQFFTSLELNLADQGQNGFPGEAITAMRIIREFKEYKHNMENILYGQEALYFYDRVTGSGGPNPQFTNFAPELRSKLRGAGGIFIVRAGDDRLVWFAYNFGDGSEVDTIESESPAEAVNFARGKQT